MEHLKYYYLSTQNKTAKYDLVHYLKITEITFARMSGNAISMWKYFEHE